jgi:O-antigen/teichoic acid export membrane protein
VSAKGRSDINLIAKVIMFLTVLATIILVKWFGGAGASLSRVLVALLPMLFLTIWSFIKLDIKYPWKSLASVSVITAAIVGLHLIFGNLFHGIFWIAEFFISVAMFVGGLFLFREIDEVDLKVLDSVLFFK